MPEWTDPKPQRPKMNAKDALKKLKESKEGESGVIELEGQDVLEFLSGMFGGEEGEGKGVPDSLREALAGMSEGTVFLKAMKKADIPVVTDEMREVLSHHANTRAEDDDMFWDAEREVGEGTSSYREMKQMAEFVLANVGSPTTYDASAASAFAHVILYLIEQLMQASNLLRNGQNLIEKQQAVGEQMRVLVEQYRDHMIAEHGVSPDGMS